MPDIDEREERLRLALHHAEYGWARGRWVELANDVRWMESEIHALVEENRWLNRRVAELQQEAASATPATR